MPLPEMAYGSCHHSGNHYHWRDHRCGLSRLFRIQTKSRRDRQRREGSPCAIKKSHTTNLREEQDQRHSATMDLLKELGRDVRAPCTSLVNCVEPLGTHAVLDGDGFDGFARVDDFAAQFIFVFLAEPASY